MTTATADKVVAVAEEPKKLILSIDQMLAAEDVEYAVIPTWKVKDAKGELVQGYCRIGSLNAEDVVAWRATGEGPAKKTMGVRIFVNSLVDENDKRIGSPSHYAAFARKSNAIQERVVAEIIRMNGLVQKNEQQVCPTCGAKFAVQTGGVDDTKNV